MSYAKTLRLTPAQWRAVLRALDAHIHDCGRASGSSSGKKATCSAELARKKIQTAMMRP
jgi:hypothetical protein